MDAPLFSRLAQAKRAPVGNPALGPSLGLSTSDAPRGQANALREGVALDLFLDYLSEKSLELYPAQEEAILELYSGKNVILNTPTGSGKSLVATALHFKSLSEGRRSVYTSPIKALVNEKFLALCREFGPEQVGMITGDGGVNAEAPILCCTAEILSIQALRMGARTPVDDVIMDEFHYYSDRERGMAWQVPLLTLHQARFLLMSATLGETEFFEKELTRLNGLETTTVRGMKRPVPLEFKYAEVALHELIPSLIRENKAPIYVVNFTQRDCADTAQSFLSIDFCTKEEKKAISLAMEETPGHRFTSPYGKEVHKLLRHGVGLHHAGLLPKYRVLAERLAQKGLLKLICGTDTLGVGVNIPIRTVLFTKLCKFDGEKTLLLPVRDFHQISGRAGRKGFDDLGFVVAMAPEHVIENLRNEQKASGDPKKLKKLVKRKPPEKGFVPWSGETFQKLVEGRPEPLQSRFQVNHGLLLHVLGRTGEDGCQAMRALIRRSHEPEGARRKLARTSFELFRSLHKRKLLEIIPPGERTSLQKIRVQEHLQEDFSLHQTLSLYLIDTVKLLDPSDPEYALDLLTLVESISEDPDLILRRQLDRVRTRRMAELKEQGMDFDERVAELEHCEYPKPNRDFIYDTFNDFAAAHPWVGQENIRPKSVAREMYEVFSSFSDYIKEYELQRVEGLLLRYLVEVYKTLTQIVPDYAKNDEIFGMEDYLGAMVRQVDSSLLDEWERLRRPGWTQPAAVKSLEGTLPATLDVTLNRKAFTILVRNEAFRMVRALSSGDFEAVVEQGEPGEGALGLPEIEARMKEYLQDHARIQTDPKARAPANTIVSPGDGEWKVQQVLVDPEGHNDWGLELSVVLERSKKLQRPVLRLLGIAQL